MFRNRRKVRGRTVSGRVVFIENRTENTVGGEMTREEGGRFIRDDQRFVVSH